MVYKRKFIHLWRKNWEEEKGSKEYSFSLAHEKEKKKRGIEGDTGALYTLRKQLTLFSDMHWGKSKVKKQRSNAQI